MTEASLKRSAKASFSTEAHVASQSDDSSLSSHTDDLLINPKAGIGPAPDCKSNEPWLAMQSRRVPTINGGLPSYDSPRRQSSSPLPKWIENFYVWIYDQPVTSPITAGHPLEGITGEIRQLESIDWLIKLTLKNLTRANNNEVAGIKRPRMRMRKRITINNPLTGLVRQILKLAPIDFFFDCYWGEGGVDDRVVGCILRLEAKEWGIVSMKTTERLKREGKGNKASFRRGKTRMTAPGAHDQTQIMMETVARLVIGQTPEPLIKIRKIVVVVKDKCNINFGHFDTLVKQMEAISILLHHFLTSLKRANDRLRHMLPRPMG
ncbi:hypothetical protein PPACK8108_LOCUS25255 [Phakopsora pachyrhizi]|uniref:Uncharacterized protein n=1 Tax=Phakopsora pachyrhizi TaxID=170000 RepID=A0AAV0BUA8_PHAPC|nr:hypothetical protein PPACK8108_LOCUS25255 [Phakopsora pachyrhizi]